MDFSQKPVSDQVETNDPVKVAADEKQFALKCLAAVEAREGEFKKGWWLQAEKAEKIYSADSDDKIDFETPYNILYSNTEVLLPSLYSATPKPDVRARFRLNLAPLPEMLDRYLTVASDPANPGGDSFNIAMSDAVLSSLVPGLGYVRIKYVEDRAFPLVYESGHYKTILWGKATRWAKTPWVCFVHKMTKQALATQFKLPAEEMDANYVPTSQTEEEKDDCTVYEFWDKQKGKVYFLCDEWEPKQLKVADDPLGLENFYPTPGLLQLTARNGKMNPIPLYNFYRNQAEELNRVTTRLNKVLSAIRVRGAYNSLLAKDLEKILGGDSMENELIAAGEAGLLAQSGGFDKQIWLLPIDMLVGVAQQLYQAREAIKQVIYEITGISDIIRGSSVASETATAQDLKNKWGTVRLRRMQTLVADYARDLFRMSVDCGSDHIPAKRWKEITQMDIPTAEEQKVAQQQLQYMQQQQAQQAQMMAMHAQMQPPPPPQGGMQAGIPPNQPPGQPPGPPQPPPPDPKLVKAAQGPNIEQLLEKIKSDMNRTFVVNIQTSSTIDLDSAQDKGEVSEFMNALGQLVPALGGLTTLGPTGVDVAKSILLAVCSRFKFGIDIAPVIEKLQAPPPPPPEQKGPPPPSPEETQAIAAVAQAKIIKAQSDIKVTQAQEQASLSKIQTEQQQFDIQIQSAQLNLAEQRATMAHNEQMRALKRTEQRNKPVGPAARDNSATN